jgi:hypothetical protein
MVSLSIPGAKALLKQGTESLGTAWEIQLRPYYIRAALRIGGSYASVTPDY